MDMVMNHQDMVMTEVIVHVEVVVHMEDMVMDMKEVIGVVMKVAQRRIRW